MRTTLNERIDRAIGVKFHRWTVVKRVADTFSGKYRKARVLVRCDCGTEKEVTFETLERKNPSKSCGCLKSEVTTIRNKAAAKHGMSGRPEYGIWVKMKRRCSDKSDTAYAHYGGRGIEVCDRWQESIENFLEDMGPRPSALHSLERKDNSLGYSPENCVWATMRQQANNRRSNKHYLFDGRMLTLSELSRVNGVPARIIRNRVDKLGFSVCEAVTRPVRGRSPVCIPSGASVNVADAMDAIRDILAPYGLFKSVAETLVALSI